MSATDNPTTTGAPAPKRPLALIAAAALGALLLLDAAIETFLAGSAVRWWVIGAAVAYGLATATLWRTRTGWYSQLAVAIFGVLGLIAVTAWLPDGLTNGIRMFGQPTSRVMSAVAAAGVALAGLALARVRPLPLAARIGVGVIAAYGVIAFIAGAVDSAPLPALLSGQSLWQRLPAVLQGAFVGGVIVLPIGLVWSIVRAGLRRPPEMSIRAEAWKIVALATSFAVVLAGLPLRSGAVNAIAVAGSAAQPENLAALLGIDPNAPKPSQEALNSALANSLRAIEDGEREAARDRWDTRYVMQALEADPQRMFDWVQRNTAWIPYHGLLRGATGVLMDRLGNSLDRAALLATLLRDSGRTVRFAHGSLQKDRAASLLGPLLLGRYTGATENLDLSIDRLSPLATQYQLDESSLRRMMAAQSDFAARKRAQLLSKVPEQTKRLTTSIGSRPNDDMTKALERAIEALQDHWWVQVSESGGWQDFDLLSPSIGSAVGTSDRTIELDAFPRELRHQVTVRVIAEQWANDALTEHVALEGVLRLSQLVGTPIALRFMPSKFPAKFPAPNMSPEQALRALALDQHEWTPVLVIGKEPTVQSVIRETGDVVSAKEAAQASGGMAGGAMSGLTKKLEDALGPPTTAPEAKPGISKTLTSASIEYEIQQPGQPPQKIRRMLFDLIGPAARTTKSVTTPQLDETKALTRSLALMRETEILPIVCRFTPSYVTHLAAQSMLANRDILSAAVGGTLQQDIEHAQEVANRLTPMPTNLYGLALARFEWSRFVEDIYIDRPNVLTRHTFFAPAATSFKLVAATDIVANDIGIDVAAADPFTIRVEQGVLDTNAEAILASSRPNGSNAGSAFAASGNWTTLRAPSDPRLNTIRLSGDVRQRIADDLAAGYVVVAPRSPVPIGATEFSGWWRVNPRTGETLGVGETGWGQEMVEWLVTFALQEALLWFLLSFIWCTMSSSTPIAQQGTGCVTAAVEAAVIAFLLALITGGLSIYTRAPKPPGGGLGGDPAPGLPGGKPGGPGPSNPGPPGGGPGGKPGGNPGSNPGSGNGPPSPSPFEQAKARSDAAAAKYEALRAEAEKTKPVFGFREPEVQQALKEAHDAAMDLMKTMRGGGPPKGPGGTQIIPGPGGTEIIPTPRLGGSGPGSPPPASPTSPTQPQINCAGTPCASPYDKTQTGLNGVLNTLGKKGGS